MGQECCVFTNDSNIDNLPKKQKKTKEEKIIEFEQKWKQKGQEEQIYQINKALHS